MLGVVPMVQVMMAFKTTGMIHGCLLAARGGGPSAARHSAHQGLTLAAVRAERFAGCRIPVLGVVDLARLGGVDSFSVGLGAGGHDQLLLSLEGQPCLAGCLCSEGSMIRK